jgi:Tol biopolymer transport system component
VWSADWPIDVSMDGRYVAHLEVPGGTALFLHDLSTGADRAVTSPQIEVEGTITTAKISRNGTRIAYDWCTRLLCELRVADIQPSGISKPRKFFENEDVRFPYPLDWSPDGKSVAVLLVKQDNSSQIGFVSVRDGSLRGLTSLSWRGTTDAFFSPDGRWLAFDRVAGPDSDQRDVFIMAVDASREVPAVVHRSNDEVVGWSPDGALLFTSDRNGGSIDLWSIGFREGRVQGSAEFIQSAIGSPLRVTNSGALYTTSEGGDREIEIASMDLATGKQLAAPVRPIDSFIGTNTQPTWSPDGSLLAYQSRRMGALPLIAIRSEKTGDVRDVHPATLTWFTGLSWWPDAGSFAVLGRDDKGRQGIFRIDANTGAVTAVGNRRQVDYGGFSWSPDGRYMYFRNGAIWELNLESGTERMILRRANAAPSLSPDGHWLATGTEGKVVVVTPATGEVREILQLNPGEQTFGRMPWTPDGRGIIVRKVLAESGGKSELWLVSTVGEPPLKLDIDANRISIDLELHPNGKRLAFLTGERKTDVWVLENFLQPKAAK